MFCGIYSFKSDCFYGLVCEHDYTTLIVLLHWENDQNGDVCKSSEPIFTFVQRKKLHVYVEKIEMVQENNKTMYRYCFSLNSICVIKAEFLPLLFKN